jgi:hypothetical protein
LEQTSSPRRRLGELRALSLDEEEAEDGGFGGGKRNCNTGRSTTIRQTVCTNDEITYTGRLHKSPAVVADDYPPV